MFSLVRGDFIWGVQLGGLIFHYLTAVISSGKQSNLLGGSSKIDAFEFSIAP